MTRFGFYTAIIAAVFALVMVASPASAHTVQIKWSDNGGGSYTFYALTYHGGTQLSGGIILNGTTHMFTSTIPKAAIPAAASYGQQEQCPSSLGSSSFLGVRWLVVTVENLNFCTPVTITTTAYSVIESPFPLGACYPLTVCLDSEAPVITPSSLVSMWSPNHQYMEFGIADIVASVSDNCSNLDVSDVSIHHAWSDEVENGVGLGDGDTMDDIMIACDGKSIKLRKERQGSGNGRVYTVHVKVTDGCGNTGEAFFQAEVKHSKNGLAAVDDGVAAGYAVYSCLAKQGNNVAGLPLSAVLDQNYPNPFNPSTTISYTLPESGNVRLSVFNSLGQLVAQPVNGVLDAGSHSTTWNAVSDQGVSLPSGLYMYQLEYAGQSVQRTMLLMK